MEENLNSSESVSEVVDTQTEQTVETNNAEVVETQTEKPVQTPEENSKFAEMRRARETAEAKAQQIERDYSVAKKYAKYDVFSEADIKEKHNMTLSEFESAVHEQEMKDKGIDPDTYKKLVEEDPTVKEAREWKQKQIAEEKARAEIKEFRTLFKKENGRPFDDESDILPPEVIERINKGEPLTVAYIYYTNEKKDARIAELEGKKQAEELNQKNAETSMGSVTGNGSADSGFITEETFLAKKSDQRWVINNLDKINESRKKW